MLPPLDATPRATAPMRPCPPPPKTRLWPRRAMAEPSASPALRKSGWMVSLDAPYTQMTMGFLLNIPRFRELFQLPPASGRRRGVAVLEAFFIPVGAVPLAELEAAGGEKGALAVAHGFVEGAAAFVAGGDDAVDQEIALGAKQLLQNFIEPPSAAFSLGLGLEVDGKIRVPLVGGTDKGGVGV